MLATVPTGERLVTHQRRRPALGQGAARADEETGSDGTACVPQLVNSPLSNGCVAGGQQPDIPMAIICMCRFWRSFFSTPPLMPASSSCEPEPWSGETASSLACNFSGSAICVRLPGSCRGCELMRPVTREAVRAKKWLGKERNKILRSRREMATQRGRDRIRPPLI